MLFSIIVPIYNVEQYLDRCVRSLLNQTFSDIEIILVDDGSNDASPKMCDEYAALDSRVKVIHKENGGLSDARNFGLRAASGKYVMFVDSDDYIELDACQTFAPYCAKDYDVIVGDGIVEGNRKLDMTHISTGDKACSGLEYLKAATLAHKALMTACLNICKRSFLVENGLEFKKGILHEDEQFTPRMLLRAGTVVCTGKPFYRYVIRESSIMTKRDKRKNAQDLYVTFLELEKLYEQIEDEELYTLLMDSFSTKYLNIFQEGKLFQYGDEYLHKDFVKKNAHLPKTKAKAALYSISPRIYYYVNLTTKKIQSAL